MTFGFNRVERRLSEIEEDLGVRFIEPENDRYRFNVGEEVVVHVGPAGVIGVYKGTTIEGLVIVMPSVVAEQHPSSRGESASLYRLETQRPNAIDLQAVTGMCPMRKGFLEEYVAKQRTPRIEIAPDYSI